MLDYCSLSEKGQRCTGCRDGVCLLFFTVNYLIYRLDDDKTGVKIQYECYLIAICVRSEIIDHQSNICR